MRMRPRHLVAITALLALTPASAWAQGGGPEMAQARHQALVDTAVAQMDLSEEKETAFRRVMADFSAGVIEIFEGYDGQRNPQMREDIMALQAETDAKLETIFTEAEMAQFNAIRDAVRAQFRRGRPPQG